MMPRANERWTDQESSTLHALLAAGFCKRTIADRLQRTVDAVKMRIKVERRGKQPKATPVSSVETIAIGKDKVCEFYLKGWRFEQFSNEGLCVMRKERRL